eukprot:gb/GECG01013685.1/.p1 GENE.gb/GECG01013685.1/~~gb/GECG01013685.1/.p1  ORF type:complete len:1276 (+),score=172.66 gb/GECG01013685.1/:1-3828(+)
MYMKMHKQQPSPSSVTRRQPQQEAHNGGSTELFTTSYSSAHRQDQQDDSVAVSTYTCSGHPSSGPEEEQEPTTVTMAATREGGDTLYGAKDEQFSSNHTPGASGGGAAAASASPWEKLHAARVRAASQSEPGNLARDGSFILYQHSQGTRAVVLPQSVESSARRGPRVKLSSCLSCCSCLDNVPIDLEEARRNWRSKFSAALDKVKNSKILRRGQMDSAFFIIARLFAHEDVVSQLYKYFDKFPAEFRFYIPQLMTFLVHGLPEDQGPLEVFLMDRCERSLLFAHKVYWFLNSFAHNVEYSSEISGAITRGHFATNSLRSAVEVQGAAAARRFIEYGPGRVQLASAPVESGNEDAGDEESQVQVQVAPEHGLVEKDRQAWQERTLGRSSDHSVTETQTVACTTIAGTTSSVTSAIATDSSATSTSTSFNPRSIQAPWSAITDEGLAAFRGTIDLVDELMNLSTRLIPVPFDQRNDQLKEGLNSINNAFLPSSSVYVPIGRPYNRLLQVHASHSFCFKTKERVPFLTVLEVIDLDPRLYGERSVALDEDESDDEETWSSHLQQGAAAAGAVIRRAAGQVQRYFKTKYDAARMRHREALSSSDSDEGYSQSHRRQSSRPKRQAKKKQLKTKNSSKRESTKYARQSSATDEGARASAATAGIGDIELQESKVSAYATTADSANRGRISVSSSSTSSISVPAETRDSRNSYNGPSLSNLQQALLHEGKDEKNGRKRSKARKKKREKQQRELRKKTGKDKISSHNEDDEDAYTEEEVVTSSSDSPVDSPPQRASDEPHWSDAAQETARDVNPETFVTPTKTAGTGNRLGMWGKASDQGSRRHSDRQLAGSGSSKEYKSASKGNIEAAQKEEGSEPGANMSPERGTGTKPRSRTSGTLDSQDTAAEDAAIERELNIGLTDFEQDTMFSDVDDVAPRERPEETVSKHAAAGGARIQAGPVEYKATSSKRKTNREELGENDQSQSDPIYVAFPEKWRDKEAGVRRESPYGHLKGWRLMPMIVKSNDDLRQEQFVCQLLRQLGIIWKDAGVPVWLRAYDILATCRDGGLIEAIPDTISLDALKRGDSSYTSLSQFFERYFNRGKHGEKRLRIAKSNFARSLAAYSITCYLLQIKDRHNGNILLDANGHIVHIDFGFLLTNSPGGNMGFEAAPFKLTQEFADVLGGPRSRLFQYYRSLCVRAFLEARRHRQKIMLLVEMMLAGNRDLPCFVGGQAAVLNSLHDRFKPNAGKQACVRFVNDLIDRSMNNWRTRWYDKYQRWAMGIL